ncbi:hypothetical protein PISL3812_09976 [Talaromyces islandicus]|uniref:Uncharacterized protein n=1 Tax=Talaromyces islandicus TaxID=28573 RepID=A0A0U1MD08_TALIS|nr:hypothetical protein PISL3812_09976 [Talaromyces islandicus]
MPRQTRVVKPQHEKSLRELLTQERNLADGLFGKAHQLFVKCDAKVALTVQFPRSGRMMSYYSDDSWPSGADLEALLNPMVESLSTSDFTNCGKRISRIAPPINGGNQDDPQFSRERLSQRHDSDLEPIGIEKTASTESHIQILGSTVNSQSRQTNYGGITGPLASEPRVLDAPSQLSILCNPAEATKIMTCILWNCVKYNYSVGNYGQRTQRYYANTDVENMRRYLDVIVQCGYEEAVGIVRRNNVLLTGKGMQTRHNEAVYWDIILKGAKRIDPARLPTLKGPLDGFTQVEKVATKNFMQEAGFATGLENQRQCRNLWRKLSELRKADIGRILLYRTKEFDSFCKSFVNDPGSSLVDVVVSWEKGYGPLMEQLEIRMREEGAGDFTGASVLRQTHVRERLDIDERSWNTMSNSWRFYEEAAAFRRTYQPTIASNEPLRCISDQHVMAGNASNKSIFTFLFPRDDTFLSVCPIVPINKGDDLGVFAGEIRFSDDFDPLNGMRGPLEKLWLDYSRVTGTLNQMKVSQDVDEANVRLHWETTNGKANTDPCPSWIVSVKAVKAIMPFEELIRESPQKEQYLLHQSETFARQGFMKNRRKPRA